MEPMQPWSETHAEACRDAAKTGREMNRIMGHEVRPVKGFGVTSEHEARIAAEERDDVVDR